MTWLPQSPDALTGHPHQRPNWTVGRVLFLTVSCIALAIAGYLTAMKLGGQITELAGCGGEQGCGSLLQGRWANWMLIPVSAWAIPIYLAMVALGGLGFQEANRRRLAFALTSVLAAAAVWFLGIQLLIERQVCLYCITMHACGLIAFAIAAAQVLPSVVELGTALKTGGLAASLAMAVLITGQLFGPTPPTHQMTNTALAVEPEIISPDSEPPKDFDTDDSQTVPQGDDTVADSPQRQTPSTSPERIVSYLDGNLKFPIKRLPHLGKIDAPHVLVEYFDYSCPACRRMHGDLAELRKRNPGKVAVITLPCPLNRKCNPHVKSPKPGVETIHVHACELARVALAVWYAAPEHFEQFHDELFDRQGRVTGSSARVIAEGFVSPEVLAAEIDGPNVTQVLDHAITTYGKMKGVNDVMPKVLFGGRQILHGNTKERATFLREAEKTLGLTMNSPPGA